LNESERRLWIVLSARWRAVERGRKKAQEEISHKKAQKAQVKTDRYRFALVLFVPNSS